MTEKQLQSRILKAINALHGVWAKAHVATAYTGKGHPDIYGCYFGQAFFAEVKLPDRKPTKLQEAVLRNIKEKSGAKCFCFVWTTVEQAVDDIVTLPFTDRLI